MEDYYREGTLLIEVVDTSVGIAHKHFSKVFGEFAQFDAQKLQLNRSRSKYLRCCKFYSFIRSDGTLGWRWIGAVAMDQPRDSQASRKQDLLPLGWRRIRDYVLLRPTHLQESPPSGSRHQSHREACGPRSAVARMAIFVIAVPERKVGPLRARCTAADTCRVLVVDDSALNVKMVIRQLSRCAVSAP